jgi:hypothetical protein
VVHLSTVAFTGCYAIRRKATISVMARNLISAPERFAARMIITQLILHRINRQSHAAPTMFVNQRVGSSLALSKLPLSSVCSDATSASRAGSAPGRAALSAPSVRIFGLQDRTGYCRLKCKHPNLLRLFVFQRIAYNRHWLLSVEGGLCYPAPLRQVQVLFCPGTSRLPNAASR